MDMSNEHIRETVENAFKSGKQELEIPKVRDLKVNLEVCRYIREEFGFHTLIRGKNIIVHLR